MPTNSTAAGVLTAVSYPDWLRRIKYHDRVLPALTITELYRARWRVELFFQWVKQQLRIKSFFDTSHNAVKSQLWTAISVYVLIPVTRKHLNLDLNLHTILQIPNLSVFEKCRPKAHIGQRPSRRITY